MEVQGYHDVVSSRVLFGKVRCVCGGGGGGEGGCPGCPDYGWLDDPGVDIIVTVTIAIAITSIMVGLKRTSVETGFSRVKDLKPVAFLSRSEVDSVSGLQDGHVQEGQLDDAHADGLVETPSRGGPSEREEDQEDDVDGEIREHEGGYDQGVRPVEEGL